MGRKSSALAHLGMTDAAFWSDNRVLVTGHTGFKGSWLSLWLNDMGAEVFGLALAPDTEPALFDQLGLRNRIDHAEVDLRDAEGVTARIHAVAPDVVFHLAAQPLVRRSYAQPVETWATNVQGTVHVLDAIRTAGRPCTVVVSTTDKVYQNREWTYGYRESDRLGGHDPYSASKAATELVIASYRDAFFAEGDVKLASARAGNVIGGGDWAEDRIIPDLVRSLRDGRAVEVRNPGATRPWQHVLEPLSGYLAYAERLHTGTAPPSLNFGPDPNANRPVGDLLDVALRHWPGGWRVVSGGAQVHEAGRLALSTELARDALGWSPRWGFEESVKHTIDWYRAVTGGADALTITRAQIQAFGGGT
ncbi:CDP-glucose 4,6-dehydratase [Jannaschia helgolandensis]|uniref:CDP-glucose 4,6-dehydratase n=1 Tax=Jannaschia helgolandensis TaxID=188906 RepID=UPI0030DA6DCC